MRARVTKSFSGVPDNSTHPVEFKPGDHVEGELAVVAVREKWAEPDSAATQSETAAKSSPKKRRRKRSADA